MVLKRRLNGLVSNSVNFSIESIKNNKYLQNKTFNYIVISILIIPIVLFILLSDYSQPIDVYLIPHSHIEIGDLDIDHVYNKTSIILDNIVNELSSDKDKTFNWAEVNYFSKWYESQNQQKKKVIKELIKNQQLEFIGGGLVQNEESIINVDGILEQVTQGHMWLKDTFNIKVEYAWQIDTIGHSSSTPTLFSQIGIKGLVINKITNSVKEYLKKWKEMEFIWRGSETLNQNSELMVTVLNDGYDSPSSLNPTEKISMGSRVSKFIYYLKQQAKTVKSNVLLVPVGGKFAFSSDNGSKYESQFEITSKVIEKVLKNKDNFKINSIQYSTLSKYFVAVKGYYEYNIDSQHITLFNKEFLPFKNEETNQYWTGYYSNQPIFKKQVRDTLNLLRSVESLYTLASLESRSIKFNPLVKLQNQLSNIRNNISLVQDHSIITGSTTLPAASTSTSTSTSKVSTSTSTLVPNNLKSAFSILQQQRINSYSILSNSFEYLLNKNSNVDEKQFNEPFSFENVIDLDKLKSNELYSIVYHNSLGWESNHHTSIRVKSSNQEIIKNLQLIDSISMEPLIIQAIKIQPDLLECFPSSNHYSIYSIIRVPPLGVKTFFLKVGSGHDSIISKEFILDDQIDVSEIVLSSTLLEFSFDKFGMLKSILNSDRRQIKHVKQYFSQYNTKKGSQYVFKASKQQEQILAKPIQMIYYDGPLVSQLTLIYDGIGSNNSNANGGGCSEYSIVHHRTFKRSNDRGSSYSSNERYLETSYSFIGQANTEKTIKIEIESIPDTITQFYTDNGIESRKRELEYKNIYDKDPLPIESSYYPAINYIKVKDQTFLPKRNNKDIKYSRYRNEQYTVYVDHTTGATFRDRTIEIMLHRSVGGSDIGDQLSRVDGRFYFNFDSIETQKQVEKRTSIQIQNPPIYMSKKISDINHYKDNYIQIYSPLLKDLPEDIHIQSLKSFTNNRVGLRLFNINNNDLDTLKILKSSEFRIFDLFKVDTIKETTLSFNEISNYQNNLGLYSTLDNHYPIVSGESEYSNIIRSKNRFTFKLDNDNKFTISQLQFKSFIMEFKNSTLTNQKVNNNIQLNSGAITQSSGRFLYDFSFLQVSPALYDSTVIGGGGGGEDILGDDNDTQFGVSNLFTFTILLIIVFIIYLANKKRLARKSND